MSQAARFVLAAGLCLSVACELGQPTPPDIGSPSAAISDGAHLGNPDFFFLTPISNPAGTDDFGDAFNGDLAPVVQICEGTAADPIDNTLCSGTEIAKFTLTSGPGGETIRLSSDHYAVNWHTTDFPLNMDLVYRIRVIVGTNVLGFADVEVGANRSELKNVVTNDFVPLVDGRTLPIKFRIESAALCDPPGNDPCTSKTINLSEQNEVVFETGERIDIPPQGSGQIITVTIQLCNRLGGIEVDLLKVGKCLTITSDPPFSELEPAEGQEQFALSPPASVSMCNVELPGLDPDQLKLLTMHRQDNGAVFALPHGGQFCDGPPPIGSRPSNMFLRLVRRVGDFMAPRPLHAATAVLDVGPSGETDFFSDFQLALPAQMFPADGTDEITGEVGGEASPVPAVVMMDAGDPSQPVAGALVTFRVTGGDGNFGTDEGEPITEVQVLSDVNGRAEVPLWILGGEGTNTVTASGRGFAGPDDAGPFTPDISLPTVCENEEPCQETVQLPDPLDDREVVFTAALVEAAEFVYGTNSADDGLSTINVSTGAVTLIGRLDPDVETFTTPIAMAVRPSDQTLFVWNNSNPDGVLLTVDPCTGDASRVSEATADQGTLQALAFSPGGTLYGLETNLYQIDPATGVKTLIAGPLGIRVFGADFVGSTLYVVSSIDSIYTVDPMTGAPGFVGRLTPRPGIPGSIVYDGASGRLMGTAFDSPLTDPAGGSVLFDINPATAAVSNVRPLTGGSAPQGMGFAPVCPSEP